jgi:hypothetical protein
MYGLGILVMEVEKPELGAKVKVIFTLTQVSPFETRFIHAAAVQMTRPRTLPFPFRRAAGYLLALAGRQYNKKEILKDNAVWIQRNYLHRPGLASCEKQMITLRRWAKQFYPLAKVEEGGMGPSSA